MKKSMVILCVVLLLLGVVGVASATPIKREETGHYYEVVEVSPISWSEANELANNSSYNGMPGHLMTITSHEEVDWMFHRLDWFLKWLGGYQDTNDPDYSEPDGGWKWVTGEEWDFTRWSTNSPDNAENGENYLIGGSTARWGDGRDNYYHEGYLIKGYIVEYEPVSEPIISLDIKPGSCPNPLNVKSKGVLPVAILGTSDFDVTTIDVSTVLLEGIGPIGDALEDVAAPFNGVSHADCLDCTKQGSDGITDLTLKFETQEIVTVLGEVNDGDCIALHLSGVLLDGSPFEGIDYIIGLSNNGKGQNEEPDKCYVGVAKTGQTICYNVDGTVIDDCTGTGQDGEYQAGKPWPNPRFMDNEDGTVSDILTDLMWTKDAKHIHDTTYR